MQPPMPRTVTVCDTGGAPNGPRVLKKIGGKRDPFSLPGQIFPLLCICSFSAKGGDWTQ